MDDYDWTPLIEERERAGSASGGLPLDSLGPALVSVKGLPMGAGQGPAAPRPLTKAMLFRHGDAGRFKFKWQAHSSWKEIWTTKGYMAETQLSIWAPMFKLGESAKVQIPMGHFGRKGFNQPGKQEAFVLEITDQASAGFSGIFHSGGYPELDAFHNQLFPYPVK